MSNRVSVVIPAYKAERTICRAVDSVLAQSLPAYEIIVVDDGSPDGQNEVIERTYGDKVILIRQANGKTASARNAGIERATGDFIAFLDADDYWDAAKLKKQIAVFDRHPQVAMVAGRARIQELNGICRDAELYTSRGITWDAVVTPSGPDAFRLGTQTWTGTVMIRRSVIGDLRFLCGLEPAEDRDFWIAVTQRYPVYHLSDTLATYVLEPGSISRSGIERDCNSMLKVVDRYNRLLGWTASREWRSHVLYRWSANDSDRSRAWPNLLQSISLWPLPYVRCPNPRPFGRFKLLLRHLLTFLTSCICPQSTMAGE